MNREVISENRSHLVMVGVVLGIMTLVCIGIWMGTIFQTNQNDKNANHMLKTITYTEDKAEKELRSIEPYTKKSMMSVSVRGKLFRSMAELSYMTGEEMLYNQYVADALFYLEKAGDTDSVVYLTNKYIGRLYANGCYDSAAKVLTDLSKKAKIDKLSSQMQASYYLSCADVDQMQEIDAAKFLEKAKAAIQTMKPGGEKKLHQAKYDLLTARNEIQKNNFKKAEAIMSKYSQKDNFGLGKNQVYVVCDFEIPYCEMMAKIQLHQGKLKQGYYHINQYLKFCDNYQFRSMKLHLLQYVVANLPDSKSLQVNQYRKLEKSVSDQNLSKMTTEYGQFLLSDIKNTTKDLQQKESKQLQVRRRVMVGIGILYSIVILMGVLLVVFDHMNRDSLTGLRSRKMFEKMREQCEQKRIPYGFLIIDIDDFKKINDTFGHAAGDEVLREIGKILRSYVGRGIHAYRYGGEELCMYFLRVPEERTREIADEIRSRIKNTLTTKNMKVTISGGIGLSKHGENVFQEADRKLYESKNNGKNQVR